MRTTHRPRRRDPIRQHPSPNRPNHPNLGAIASRDRHWPIVRRANRGRRRASPGPRRASPSPRRASRRRPHASRDPRFGSPRLRSPRLRSPHLGSRPHGSHRPGTLRGHQRHRARATRPQPRDLKRKPSHQASWDSPSDSRLSPHAKGKLARKKQRRDEKRSYKKRRNVSRNEQNRQSHGTADTRPRRQHHGRRPDSPRLPCRSGRRGHSRRRARCGSDRWCGRC
jgi:hypothetical protein